MSRRSRRFLAPVALVLALVAAACSQSSAGDGYKFSAEQLSRPSTTTALLPATDAPATPETPKAATETEIATAKVPEIQVMTQKPGGGGNPAVVKASALPPIPRDGYASAGARKTPTGYAFTNPTYFQNPLVFVVLERDGEWLHVMLPTRPNGQTGWIKAADVNLSRTTYRMELNLASTTLKVFNGNDLFVETKVVIGKPSSKTPLGTFYLNEKVKSDNPAGAYGPWILSTNGYSEDLNEFDGGLPVVAFHGTNQPQLLGQSVSNGCIRMPNDVVTKLADTLPAGTPIQITA
jgi:lipoprotein-anchoring transpeptidase ErfK/SrfK